MRLLTLRRLLALSLVLLAVAAPARAQYNPAQSIPAGFLDISVQTGNSSGIQIAAAEADVGVSTPIAVPAGFTMTYFGAAVTTFQVSANGLLTINTTATTSSDGNGILPSATTPNAVIAPFWDDLDNDDDGANLVGPNEEVDYFYDAPNNRLIVQWTNARRWTGTTPSSGSLTFQAQLYASGVVEFHYATMTDPGLSYTVGLENATGTIGRMHIVNGVSPLPAGGGAVRSNTALRYTLATAPLPYTFVTQLNFPSGACTGVARGFNIAFSNQGLGTLSITGVTFTGPFVTSITTFPITLAPGASTNITAFFDPADGQTGPLQGSLTVATNGGNVVVPFSASGDPEGAGYQFRSSLATAACAAATGAGAPGTAFVPIASHTRITTWTSGDGNDGRFNLALGTAFGAAFPSFRFTGADFSTLGISSNGLVSTSTALAPTFYGGLPTANNTVQVAAMNLTTAATVAADAAGVGGAPGVFYGLTDVDADGDQDLVITWYHAYDFGSVPGAAGQYLTAQLIVYRGARANEDSYYEIRYLDGNDANGVPFRQNTTVADAAADISIEQDAVAGITEVNGVEAASYRTRGGAAVAGTNAVIGTSALYATGGGSIGVRYQAEVQAVATGQAGWRMMGMPLRGQTVARLAALNLVQSVANQYPTFPTDNLYTRYDGAAYVAATSTADALTPGRGFIWYLFNQDLIPNPANDGTGTSRSYALPMKLEATGAELAAVLGTYPIVLSTAGNGFNLLANPTRDDLDVSGIASWATGGALVSAVPQVWDPNVGGSGSYVAVSGAVSSWQGFFIQNTSGTAGATGLIVPSTARITTGTFLGREGRLYSNDRTERSARAASAATVAFELAGTDAATGRSTVDRAATLVIDDEMAADGWDLLDATKLAPLAAAYATVGFQGTGYDGTAAVKAQESRALDAASFELPLVVDAVGTAPSLTLSWAGLDALPATWALELRDVVTGATVDLRTATSYTFEQDAAAVTVTAPEALVARTTTGAQAKAADAPRFVVVVTTRGVVANEPGVPTVFALAAPAPNPTASSATIAFDVPEATDVSVAVYDLLGRRVAVLAEGAVAAGRHTARLAAGTLAPGVYVVRMTAGSFAATQRVTVVR